MGTGMVRQVYKMAVPNIHDMPKCLTASSVLETGFTQILRNILIALEYSYSWHAYTHILI